MPESERMFPGRNSWLDILPNQGDTTSYDLADGNAVPRRYLW